jgi:hypothetical protein
LFVVVDGHSFPISTDVLAALHESMPFMHPHIIIIWSLPLPVWHNRRLRSCPTPARVQRENREKVQSTVANP